MEIDTLIELVRNWIVKGTFTHNGFTYKRGVNDHSACILLSQNATLPLGEFATYFEDLMCVGTSEAGVPAKGFTIGHGKTLYWYITPYPNSGLYKCYRTFENGHVGSPRWVEPTKMITVQYE